MFRSIIPYFLVCLGFTLIGLARDMPLFEWEISEVSADIPRNFHVKLSPWTTRLGESVLGDSGSDGSYLLWQISTSIDGKNGCSPIGSKPTVKRSYIDEVLERASIDFYESIYPSLWNLSWLLLFSSGMYVWGYAVSYKRPVYEPVIFTILVIIMSCILFDDVWRSLAGRVMPAMPCGFFGDSYPYFGTITFSARLSKVHYEMLFTFFVGALAEVGAIVVMTRQIRGASNERKEISKVSLPISIDDSQEINAEKRRVFSPLPVWVVSIIGFVLGIGFIFYRTTQVSSPTEVAAPDAFPNTDIVFTPSDQRVGFVNADGSSLEYVPLVIKAPEISNRVLPTRPVITGDNKTLIVKVSFRNTYASLPEWLVISQPGKFPVICRQWSSQQMAYLSADQQEIFTYTFLDGLQRRKLSSCGKKESSLEIYDRNLYGTPSPDQKYLVQARETGAELDDDHLIVVREFSGTREWTVGVGDYPAWSRDSHWVAYTGKDGIYIVNVIEGKEPQLIVSYSYPYQDNENFPVYETDAMWKIPPEVAWSPDGKWLVYHRWKGDRSGNLADPTDYAIYKVNIATKEETMIVDEGIYPYWRWQAAEP